MIALQEKIETTESTKASQEKAKEAEQILLAKEREEAKRLFLKEQKRMLAKEARAKKRQDFRRILLRKVEGFASMILEANVIAEELNRKIKLELNLSPEFLVEAEDIANCLRIKVENVEDKTIYFWNMEKFNDRYYLIKDLLNKIENEETFQFTEENDPFWDPIGAVDIARGYLPLKHLAFLFELKSQVKFYAEVEIIGQISVKNIFKPKGMHYTLP